jgi:hypothetical protein
MSTETYLGVCLWWFDRDETSLRGGCLADISGATWLFSPRTYTGHGYSDACLYQPGTLHGGDRVWFSVELGDQFGRCGYRVSSISLARESEADPVDWADINKVWEEFQEADFRKTMGRDLRSQERVRVYARR